MNTLRYAFRPFLPAIFNEVFERQAETAYPTFKPATNVREDDKNYHLELALPGFAKEEISINFEDEILTVTAGRQVKENDNESKYTWNEFAYKEKYQRSFQLPETVDAENIGASYTDGILHITLPKKESVASATKQIQIA